MLISVTATETSFFPRRLWKRIWKRIVNSKTGDEHRRWRRFLNCKSRIPGLTISKLPQLENIKVIFMDRLLKVLPFWSSFIKRLSKCRTSKTYLHHLEALNLNNSQPKSSSLNYSQPKSLNLYSFPPKSSKPQLFSTDVIKSQLVSTKVIKSLLFSVIKSQLFSTDVIKSQLFSNDW